MKKRFSRTKARGQSIPLIAIMIVVLFGMAALALDVGNTYAEQRSVVRATNAAAIEGMNTVIAGETPQVLYDHVITSLRGNGLPIVTDTSSPQPGEVTAKIDLLDETGGLIAQCPIPGCDDATFSSIQGNISYIRVQTNGTVETYFARVVGRPTLPVNSVAHASKGLCPSGIYPIAVDDTLLNRGAQRFKNPDSLYSDEIYRNRTQKRIFLKDTNASGNFGFMRWRGDQNSGNSATDLAAGLTDAGTIGAGYVEADWPTDNTVALQKTPGYPPVPNRPSPGDWVAGAAGLMNSNAVRDQFDLHMRNRTIMTLPIYQESSGNGANAAYYMVAVGNFYLRGYGFVNPNSADAAKYGNSGWYIDLVFLGNGSQCANLVTGTSVVERMTLEGQVSFFPHYANLSDPTDLPIQYVVVLDVSGSMSWSFAGQANVGASLVTCQGGGAIYCPPGTVLSSVADRRIVVARNLLTQFVNNVRPQDQVRIVTYSNTYGSTNDAANTWPTDDEALDGLSRVYPDFWTSDKPTLTSAVAAAALDVTSGETPSAIGLARATQLYANSASTDPATGKQYKRAVILLTDGVANVTRNGLLNNPPGCGSEDTSCQEGIFPSTNPPLLKPISAMYQEATTLTNLIAPPNTTITGSGIYVIALGTQSVATSLQLISPNLYYADQPGALQTALNAIRNQVTFATCNDGGAARTSPLEQIGSNGLPDPGVLATSGVTLPDVGVVTLTPGTGGSPITGPITWDSGSGRLYYRITNIPPGQYTIQYWLAYKAPEDGITRIYTYALPITGGSLTTDNQPIDLTPSTGTIGSRIQPIVMDMNPTINVCTTTP